MVNIQQNLVKHIPSLVATWHGQPLAATKQMLSHAEVQAVSKTLLDLQRGLTGDRQLAGAGYMDNSSYLGAYLLYYWPVSYLQISYAMHDVFQRRKFFTNGDNVQRKVVRILDAGSGPAPASAAIIDALQNATDFFDQIRIEVTFVDVSDKALLLAKELFAIEYPSVPVEIVQTNFEKDGVRFLEKINQNNKFDIFVMCHALNELWKNANEAVTMRAEFIEEVTKQLSPDGMILLCEPALLETSRNLLAVRDVLLQKKFSIISPCYCHVEENDSSKQTTCPAIGAGPNHTCHAEIEWMPCEPVASLAKNAGLDRESVKMTYIALRNKSGPNESSRAKDENTVRGRVVSEGMLNKAGRIRYLICNGEKRIAISAKKDETYASKIGFFSLKRLDYVEITNPEIRGDAKSVAYGIAPDTLLKIVRFC